MSATRLAALAFILFLLAGCTGAAPTPAPTEPAATATAARTSAPSLTAAPSKTSLPTQTPLPSATATITLSPSPTPDPALAAARLLGVSWQPDYNLLLSIAFPGPVRADQYRVVVEDKEYSCQVLASQPERLFCTGQGMNVYSRVTVRIFPAGSDQPGFEGKISIPYFTN